MVQLEEVMVNLQVEAEDLVDLAEAELVEENQIQQLQEELEQLTLVVAVVAEDLVVVLVDQV